MPLGTNVLATDVGLDAAAAASALIQRGAMLVQGSLAPAQAPTSFAIGSEADLNAALAQIDVGGAASFLGMAYTLNFTSSFTLSSDLLAIDLATGDTLAINGGNQVLDGGGLYRGFFDYAGAVAINDLAVSNAVALGGSGGNGATPGGGGAGLGGGLFVAAGASVTLSNVAFTQDSAIGGAGGGDGSGAGGGGGLGGTGGAGGVLRAPGGGGIGSTATGGTGGGAGGAGIVQGAAGASSGGGSMPGVGGAGGGGGGSAGLPSFHRGSPPFPAAGGAGGIGNAGNFGGGAAPGGVAGFGGGGSQSAGGWGGGGSSGFDGGFGAGGGSAVGAGGGLGAGGAVFVQAGGTLTITSGTVSGNLALGGSASGGIAGAGFAGGIFAQGGGTIGLAPGAGQVLTVTDGIADPAGTLGGPGAEALLLNGLGTVVLSAANSFSGGVAINAGTLSLQNAAAAGTGAISFGYGAAAMLVIGAGDVPVNAISYFLPGVTIDLQGIGLATAAAVVGGHTLAVTGGTSGVTLALDPAQILTGESFLVQDDLNGGTLITAATVGGDHPPFISGIAALVTGDDHTPFSPLAAVTVSDLDPGQTETATVTLSTLANGTLSNFGVGAYDAATGVYVVSGSAADVTSALDALVFTPVGQEVAPGAAVRTGFTVGVTDGIMAASATQTAIVTALNDAPTITGTGAWLEGYYGTPVNMFAGVSVADPDVGAFVTATVTFADVGSPYFPTDGNGLLSGDGVAMTGPGTYTILGTPAAVTAALQSAQFTPAAHAQPGFVITDASLSVSDGIAPAVTATWSALSAGLPIFAGLPPDQTVAIDAAIAPFAAVSVSDSPGLLIQGLTIVLYDASGTPTDANGLLSGANLTKTDVGAYALAIQNPASGDATAFVTSEIDALVFQPDPASAGATTDFVISAFDGATTSTSALVHLTNTGALTPAVAAPANAGAAILALQSLVPADAAVASAPSLGLATTPLSSGLSIPMGTGTPPDGVTAIVAPALTIPLAQGMVASAPDGLTSDPALLGQNTSSLAAGALVLKGGAADAGADSEGAPVPGSGSIAFLANQGSPISAVVSGPTSGIPVGGIQNGTAALASFTSDSQFAVELLSGASGYATLAAITMSPFAYEAGGTALPTDYGAPMSFADLWPPNVPIPNFQTGQV